MRPRLLSGAVIAAVLAVVGTAVPSQAGPPGKWTVISGGGVVNIDEAGMYRTADGTLHVALHREANSLESVDVAHISAGGKLEGRQVVLDSWSGLTDDPDLVGAPGGGIRLVFGGIHSTNTGEPYNGTLYESISDPTGTAWTLAPSTQSPVAHPSGYASYGTGTTSLADGTLVTAFPLNSAIYYQVGAGAVQTFNVNACCAYDMSLASDGANVWAAWYANGTAAVDQGVFVRQIYPTLGPVIQAPGSVSSFGGSPGSLGTGQAVAMVYRPGNGLYLAYLKGYPTTKAVTVWKYGTSLARSVPESKEADTVAMSVGPAGRLWLAWDDASDDIRAVRTDPKGLTFGAVQLLKTPGDASVYHVNIEGNAGRGDVVYNDGTKILHQQVFAGLSVKADPGKWNGDKSVKVSFKVTDAGDAVKGAVVKAKGEKCKTDVSGKCSITFPKLNAGKFDAVAKKKEYADGSVRLKVT
jgi:hypothetical protein